MMKKDEVHSIFKLIKENSPQVTKLNGLTNLNYLVRLEHESFVVHLAGPNRKLLRITRKNEYRNSIIANKIGIGAEVNFYDVKKGILITRYVPGSPIEIKRLKNHITFETVLDKILTVHHSKKLFSGRFSPFNVIKSYYDHAIHHNATFPSNMNLALKMYESLVKFYETPNILCNCHNDLLAGNFIVSDNQEIHIVDWEYSGIGDPYFDLGNFAAHFDLQDKNLKTLATLYFDHYHPVDLRRLEIMKAVSNLRESLWGFLQAKISTLDVDYYNYGETFLQRFLNDVKVLQSKYQFIKNSRT